MADGNGYDPAQFKACTRRTVAFSIIFGSLGFIFLTMILSIFYESEAADSAMSSVVPVCAGFIGATMAFYFSDEKNDESEDAAPAAAVSTGPSSILFIKDGSFPLIYTVDPKGEDGEKSMKNILTNLNTDETFFDVDSDDGTKEFFFSFTDKLRTKKLIIGDFHELTLSNLLKMASDSVSTLKVTVTFEPIVSAGPIKEATSILTGSTDPERQPDVENVPAATIPTPNLPIVSTPSKPQESDMSFITSGEGTPLKADQDIV